MCFVCCVGSVESGARLFRCDVCKLAPLCPLSVVVSSLYVLCGMMAPMSLNLKGCADLNTIMTPGIPADSTRQACSGLDQ